MPDDGVNGNGPIAAASEGDDAEGTTVVAALLNLHKGAGLGFEAAEQMPGDFLRLHNIGYQYFLIARCGLIAAV